MSAIEISPQAAQTMMTMLSGVESATDLRNLAVINRVGMAVASSKSASTDASAITATSSALIDLSEKMSESIQHGRLHELLIRSSQGYDLLMAVSKDLMIFCSLGNPLRVGFYLGFVRDLCEKLRKIIANELPAEQLAIFTKQEEERVKKEEVATPVVRPSANQDLSAMKDLLGVLDDMDNEGEIAITADVIAQARAAAASKKGAVPDLTVGIPTDLSAAKGPEPEIDLTVGIPADLLSAKPTPGQEKPASTATIPQDLIAGSVDFDAVLKDLTPEPAVPAKSSPAPAKPAPAAPAKVSTSAGNQMLKYGVEVYDDEVPPIPLDDLNMDNLQLLGSAPVEPQVPPAPDVLPDVNPEGPLETAAAPVLPPKPAVPAAAFEYKTFEEEKGYQDPAQYDDNGNVLDFNAADEYDLDLNLKEQDAMSEALKSLGWVEEKDKDKKKKQG